MLEKAITIGDKQVKFRSSATIPRLYRAKFKRDIFKDLSRLESSYKGNSDDGSSFEIEDLEIFENVAYIRVGSYTKPLKSYPAIEAEVWNKITKADYEASVALEDVPLRNVLELLDYAKYFELLGLPLPQTQEETARYLGEDCLVVKQDDGRFAVTNLGALLLARNLSDFAGLERKAVRIVKIRRHGKASDSERPRFACRLRQRF